MVRSILRNKNRFRLKRVIGRRVPSRVGKWHIPEERARGKEGSGERKGRGVDNTPTQDVLRRD